MNCSCGQIGDPSFFSFFASGMFSEMLDYVLYPNEGNYFFIFFLLIFRYHPSFSIDYVDHSSFSIDYVDHS